MPAGVVSKIHLGVPCHDVDGRMVIYAVAHADLDAYGLYDIVPARDTSIALDQFKSGGGLPGTDAANDGTAKTAAVATLVVPHYVGAPQRAYKAGEVAKLVIGGAGKCLASNAGGAITGGTNFIEVKNTANSAVFTGTARTVNTFAFACESQDSATASAINVQFLGVPVQTQ